MNEIIKYGKFKPTGKQKKKSQIILVHTGRPIESYLLGLKYRFNGKYQKIPNYLISRDGKILQLLSNTEYSSFFNSPDTNRNSIIISLENLGWLHKEPLNDYYVNWIGDIYKGDVFERKWRDYFFWQPYTTIQLENTAKLCKTLFNEVSIENNVLGHNTKISGVEKYKGIVSRSNFGIEFTDVSPAFNFEIFLKNIENE
jgi:hypothetical protein